MTVMRGKSAIAFTLACFLVTDAILMRSRCHGHTTCVVCILMLTLGTLFLGDAAITPAGFIIRPFWSNAEFVIGPEGCASALIVDGLRGVRQRQAVARMRLRAPDGTDPPMNIGPLDPSSRTAID